MVSTPGQIRPWRYLAAFAGVIVMLYGLVFFTGDGSAAPKLGIDLQGGTRVTLEARTETGAEPAREQLVQAKQIIEERVNGLGVSGAEVVLDGTNLTITVPGQEGEQARSLGQTAQLRFREVLAGPVPAGPGGLPGAPGVTGGAPAPGAPAPGAPEPGAPEPGAPAPAPGAPADPAQPQGAGDPAVLQTPVAPVAFSSSLPAQAPAPTPAPPAPEPGSAAPQAPADPEVAAAIDAARDTRQSTDPATQQMALATLDCAAQDPLRGYDDPTLPLVACSSDGTEKYLLGPAFLEGTQIESASAQQNQQGAGWVVSLTFESQGAAIWGE